MKQYDRRRLVRRTSVTAALAVTLAATALPSALASTTNPNPSDLELANAQLSRQAATQGMVLLENHDAALPLPAPSSSGNVALFGVGAYATVKGGTGSGNVNNRYTINARTGLENAGYEVTTSPAYWDAVKTAYDTKYPPVTGGSGFGGAVDYSSVEQPLTASSVQPTAATDTAVFVLARNSGEGSDRRAGAGDYLLTDTEQADLQLLGQSYKHVVVVLNTGGIVDTAFFDTINAATKDPAGGQPLDSMLLMSQAGQESGNALADVLDGSVSPSGKLTDTWASKYSYYPASGTFANNDANSATETYSEGIYVGYRYFDSFYKKIASDPTTVVDYPFGYGLSYTDFQVEPLSVTADMKDVTVKARVTNVGASHSGKEVVETYFSAPQTGLDKPYQELAGYAKTDDLAPGDSQTVTISFDTTQLASYDESKAAWTMDAGDYLIRVGDSSRNTQVAAKVRLADTTLTEQDSHQLTDQALTPGSVLASDPADFYSYPTEAAETAAAPVVSLSTAGFTAADHVSTLDQSVPVDASSPYAVIDGDKISTTTAYVPTGQTNWEGTGAPYAAKTGETVKTIATSPTATLYDVAAGRTSMDAFVAGLGVTQLANIVEGAGAGGASTLQAGGAAGYTTPKYESLGIPAMTLSDGPAGLRITQKTTTAPTVYQFGTAWPIGTLLAQTWDRDLVAKVAEAVGKEMREYGVQLWLAPGMNIHRDPLNGRNFEYYSEDPLVAGLTAASTTEGVQSIPGVGVTIKHFALNNQETQRSGGNVVADERGMREIELKGFELGVKNAEPMAVMSSYNRIGGTYAAENYDLLTDVLRGEWGYRGLVMSDWGGSHNTLGTLYAGNDLIMPGNAPQNVVNATLKVAPAIDVAGLPIYNRTVTPTRTSYSWQFNGLTPSATGTETVSTTVNSATDLTKVPASGTTTVDSVNNQTFAPEAAYGTVNAAYTAVQALLSGTALTAAQKAGLTLTVVSRQDPNDATSPVTAYTVTLKGNYSATGYNMRLGDLQRSAERVLDIAMQSSSFQGLANVKGVSGVDVKPYSAQFSDLADTVAVDKATVVKKQGGADAPTASLTAAPVAPASGWYTGPVQVSAASDQADAQLFVDVDSGQLRPYTGPVTVSGDGVHEVRVIAARDGVYSSIRSTTVRIDSAAPTVSATSTTGGRLVLTATDAGSGVRTVEYAVGSGGWLPYTGPASIAGTSTAVRYRATDTAGNTSVEKSAVVTGSKLTLLKPKVKGTPRVGQKLKAKASATGADATLTYQWVRDGKDIKGATGKSYRVVRNDRGHRIAVEVTAKAPGYPAITKTAGTVRIR